VALPQLVVVKLYDEAIAQENVTELYGERP